MSIAFRATYFIVFIQPGMLISVFICLFVNCSSWYMVSDAVMDRHIW